MSLVSYRWLWFVAPVVLLTGCTPTQPAQSVQNPEPQATAPALSATPAQTAPAPEPPAQQPLKTPQQQRVQVLIDQVEKAYANGQTDYKKGDLPGAKAEFDRAVDLMLTSGIDIKSDQQLQDEFDRIVDGVNSLEMDALKVGNGFAPKVEPTPADVAEDITFSVDPNIVAKAKSELATTKSDLPLVVNDYVGAFINFFANTQKGHNTLLHSFQRSGRYKAMIQRVLAEEGVPQDLIYLAVAESGFQPRAVNGRSRAGGMWQFMPGPYYGLHRDPWVDERFDPEKSTRAYGRYMKFLYDQLGDWYLAMAAYDHGAGNIQRAVQRTGYADFWELYRRHELPKETQNYVPEILAAIIIANHPTQYGFDEIPLDPPVITDTVNINYPVDLRLVSDMVDVPLDELIALNPSLLRLTTPAEGQFDLHLPAGTALTYQRLIDRIPEAKRNSWRYHPVVAEDTLASVARTYHVTESELAEANQMNESDSLQGVEALIVPVPPAATPTRAMLYTARRGDTLVSIADRFGVSLTQLRRWNNLSGTKVAPGRKLRVAEPAHLVQARSTRHKASASASAADNDPAPAEAHKSASRSSSHKSGAKSTTKSGAHAHSGSSASASHRKKTHAHKQAAQ